MQISAKMSSSVINSGQERIMNKLSSIGSISDRRGRRRSARRGAPVSLSRQLYTFLSEIVYFHRSFHVVERVAYQRVKMGTYY